MDKIRMMSTNLTEHIAAAVESPFRVAADLISRTSGQSISHGGVWNLVQKLGEKLWQEESAAVKEMDAGKKGGEGDKREEHARKLLTYLQNHKAILSHYDQRGIKLSKAPEGLIYKHMGYRRTRMRR